MKLLKKPPKRIPKGYCMVMHMDPHVFEPVIWPASPTKPERVKYCHRIIGYSIRKSDFNPLNFETIESLTKKLKQEIKRGKEKE